jgi:hypothetical protein
MVQFAIDYMVDPGYRLHDIHHYTRQHLKVAKDNMKARLRPPGQLHRISGRGQSDPC